VRSEFYIFIVVGLFEALYMGKRGSLYHRFSLVRGYRLLFCSL
jgi:hypothetical protein